MSITKEDMEKIILACRIGAEFGLRNGHKAKIEALEIDILERNEFAGARGNPAFFVNSKTYQLLGKYHRSWKVNQTIVISQQFLDQHPMQIIGILVHETGHAFNVAARITNSEANAFIFEIEILSRWYKNGHSQLFHCEKCDVQTYFESRLPYYRSQIEENAYLSKLIELIEQKTILDDDVRLFDMTRRGKRKPSTSIEVDEYPKLRV